MNDVLWQSFSNVVHAGVEADALIDAVEAVMGGIDVAPYRIDIKDGNEDWQLDDHGWVYAYYLWSYRLYQRMPRQTSRGLLTFAASFYRDEDLSGAGWSGARHAKLYVGFAPTAKAWTAKTLVLDGTGTASTVVPISAWRWGLAKQSTVLFPWFFCLRLNALQSRQDIVREIAGPITGLFKGTDDVAAFAGCEAVIPTPLARA